MWRGCRACCSELRGWGGACTRAEALLALAELALLAALVAVLVLLPLHLLLCPAGAPPPPPPPPAVTSTRCTATGYETLEDAKTPLPTESTRCTAVGAEVAATPSAAEPSDVLAPELSDGEEADDSFGFLLALVKLTPSGTTFGCVVTAISARWAVTAASCVEAVEEVDSLDAFVLVEGWGRGGDAERAHAVAEARVLPGYRAGRAARDLALLRAASPLRAAPAALPAPLQERRAAIGERLALLGFGTFRSAPVSGVARRARAAGVVRLPRAQCEGAAWEPRHLRPAPPARRARPRHDAPLCAGVLFDRGTPCQFCAGAALVRGGALLGVLAAGAGCGAACEPARAAPLAARRARAFLAAARAGRDQHPPPPAEDYGERV